MELADLPGHPARKIARRHKEAVEARLASAFGSAMASAEVMLLIEGAMTLLLVHGDRRYGEIAAAAANALIRRHRAKRAGAAEFRVNLCYSNESQLSPSAFAICMNA
jgi:hypothetical protein